MTSLITIEVLFIFGMWLLALLRKFKKRTLLTKEERYLAWSGLICVIISVIFQAFQFFSITPKFLMPYSVYIVFSFIISGIILLSFLGVRNIPKIVHKRLSDAASRREKLDVDFSSFSNAFWGARYTNEETEPKTKARMLDDLQLQLYTLCRNYNWKKAKDWIDKVLKYIIPPQLSSDPHVLNYVQYLAMITNSFEKQTVKTIKEKWGKDLIILFNDPKYETNTYILPMLQLLYEYNVVYMNRLIKEAIDEWSDQRFQNLKGLIDFLGFKKRNKNNYHVILMYLQRRMADTERNDKKETCERITFLYNRALAAQSSNIERGVTER